ALRGEFRFPRVHRADARALGVGEYRMIPRAGKVVECVLARRAHVDALRIACERGHAHLALARVSVGRRGHFAAPSSVFNCGHMLWSSCCCAAPVGWMRSAWNSSSRSPMPSKKYGTSGTLRVLATFA